jgi:hypothetical protein
VIDQHRKMLDEDLTGKYNMQELRDRLCEFDDGVDSNAKKKSSLEDKMATIEREIELSRAKQSQIQTDIGRFRAEKAAHQRNLAIRFDRMVEIGSKYGLEEVVTQISQNSQLTHNAQSQNTSYLSQVDTMSLADSTVTMSQTGHGNPILDISAEDMEAFWRAVHRKEEDLETELKSQKQKRISQEDEMSKDLVQLSGKLQSLENERKRILQEDKESRSEVDRLRCQQSSTKLKTTDLEDAKNAAMKAAKARDEENNNKRKDEIRTEIDYCRNEVEKLTQKIAAEKLILEGLRKQGDDFKKIDVIKEQCQKELEDLQEEKTESHYEFMTYNVTQPPSKLPPIDSDVQGTELKSIFEKIHDEIEETMNEKEQEFERAQNEEQELEKLIGEKTALMNHDEESIKTKRRSLAKTQQCLDTASRVCNEIRDFEVSQEMPTPPNLSAENPDHLLEHISRCLEELEMSSLEGISTKVVRKIVKEMLKQSKVEDRCLCCKRRFNGEDEAKIFMDTMNLLAGITGPSPLLNTKDSDKAAKTKYEEWHVTMKPLMSSLREHKRLFGEVRDLDKNIPAMKSRINSETKKLKEAKSNVDSVRLELNALRDFLNRAKGWKDSAIRISENRTKAKRMQEDLKDSLGGDKSGRSLEEVESHLQKLQTDKDAMNQKVRFASGNLLRFQYRC